MHYNNYIKNINYLFIIRASLKDCMDIIIIDLFRHTHFNLLTRISCLTLKKSIVSRWNYSSFDCDIYMK